MRLNVGIHAVFDFPSASSAANLESIAVSDSAPLIRGLRSSWNWPVSRGRSGRALLGQSGPSVGMHLRLARSVIFQFQEAQRASANQATS